MNNQTVKSIQPVTMTKLEAILIQQISNIAGVKDILEETILLN